MGASELIKAITGGSLGVLVLLMTVIQIAPIKINPWSYLLRKLGKSMNEDIIKKVDNLELIVGNLQTSCDERAMTDCRTRILHFNDEILHKKRHTKEHFDQILIDISNYETYCNKHKDYRNNIAHLAIKHIKDTYDKCIDEDTFL